MKNILSIFLLLLGIYSSNAQTATCPGHPLFSNMPNHSVASCEEKEFDQMEIYQKDKVSDHITLTKQGAKLVVSF